MVGAGASISDEDEEEKKKEEGGGGNTIFHRKGKERKAEICEE